MPEAKVTPSGISVSAITDIKRNLKQLNENYYAGLESSIRKLSGAIDIMHRENLISNLDKFQTSFSDILLDGLIKEQSYDKIASRVSDFIQEDGLNILSNLDHESQQMFKIQTTSVAGVVRHFSMPELIETWTITAMRDVQERARHDYYQAAGYDLVVVSTHDNECPLCSPWSGVVLSISGRTKGYYTYAQATASGLFHYRCRHNTSVYMDDDLTPNSGKNPNYKPDELIDSQIKAIQSAGVKL